MKNVLEDIGGAKADIPLSLPIAAIKNSFDLLSKSIAPNGLHFVKEEIETYPFAQLVNTFNSIHFLNCPRIEDIFLRTIKKEMDKDVGKITKVPLFAQLNPDVQKSLMVEPVVDCLKDKIIKKYASDRKISLTGHPDVVLSVALSTDGKRIVSGCFGDQNNLILGEVNDNGAITHYVLVGHPAGVTSVAFSPDGKKIVSGCGGGQNNLILWDINDTGTITHQELVGHPRGVTSVAFSPDGKRIVSGCGGGGQNNLILWDSNDKGAITHQVLAGHSYAVYSVAFSADGKRIVSGCDSDQNNLILWDINDTGTITHQELAGHPGGVTSVAFSLDGKRIVSGCGGGQNNLILWILLTQQEAAILNNLKRCDLETLGLLYRVCLGALNGQGVKLVNQEEGIYNNLPELVRNLLQDSVVNSKPHVKRQAKPHNKVTAVLQSTEQQLWAQQELERKKEDIRRSLRHLKFNDKKLLAEHLAALRDIYIPGHGYYDAFNELMKELGY